MWKMIFAICTLAATASFASEGQFCNTGERVIQYVCGYYPGGNGWVPQPGNCYHRDTGRYCPNPYGYDYPINDYPGNPGYPGDPGYPGYPGNPNYGSCGPGWENMGRFTCEYRREIQRICGCRPPGANDSRIWNDERNGCYSRTTGRSCRF